MKEWYQYLWADERGSEYIKECTDDLDPKYGRDIYKRFLIEITLLRMMIILIFLIYVLQGE